MKKLLVLAVAALLCHASQSVVVGQDLSNKPLKAAVDYWKRASAKEDANDLDGALEDIRIAQSLGNRQMYFDTLEIKSRILEKKKDLAGALAALDEQVALVDDWTTRSDRAEFKARNGDFDGAVADYEAAIRIAENDTSNFRKYSLEMAQSYRKTLNDLLNSDSSPRKLLAKAISESESGNYGAAKELLDKANKVSPNNSTILVTRAYQYLFLDQPDKAKVDLDAALKAKDH